jgi:kynureninase
MTDAARHHAQSLDQEDPLAGVASRFYKQPGVIYLDGNSLGLLSQHAEAAVLGILNDWKQFAIQGWTEGVHPWFHLSRKVAGLLAPLIGASATSIALGESVTVHLHQLIASFFQPSVERNGILIDDLAFPTDRYVVESQLRLRGLEITDHLKVFASDDGQTFDEAKLINALADRRLALAVLPSVLYRSGQLLNMKRITEAARQSDVTILWDCSHSVGVVPHQFELDGIELAVGCTYKYLNGGPGAVAFLYVHPDRLVQHPGLAGWFGCDPTRQFAMESAFHPAPDAGRFLLGTPQILSLAPLLGALQMIQQTSMQAIREKSLKLTGFLREHVQARLSHNGVAIVTPFDDSRRGGHLALRHPHAAQLSLALRQKGVVPDYRPPDLLRLAPVPLYTSFSECVRAVEILEELLRTGSYLETSADGLVT